MEKVKLPREVAEALEEAKGSYGGDIEMIAWNIPREDRSDVWFWNVLYEFSLHNGGFLKLIDALRYGYEVEPEPITVTITPEMQEEIKACFKSLAEDYGPSGTMAHTFVRPLEIIGIQIPGVNT